MPVFAEINHFRRFVKRFKGPKEPTSTVGIDFSSFPVEDGVVSIWDFAGQMEYTVTHQFFLSSEVCIVEVNIFDKV